MYLHFRVDKETETYGMAKDSELGGCLGPTSDLDLMAKRIFQPPPEIEPQLPRLLAYIVVSILTDTSQRLSKRE